jgi:hypothetical protein
VHPVLDVDRDLKKLKTWDYNKPKAPEREDPDRYIKGLRDVANCTHDAETMRVIAISALGARRYA